MKKSQLSFTALLILITVNLFAQDSSMHKRHAAFGVKGGVNFGSVIARKDITNRSKGADILVGAYGGGYMTIPSGKGFSIQPEVVYNGFGWKYIQYHAPTIKYSFSYISVPVLVRYTVEQAGLSVFLGPQANFMLSARGTNDTAFKKSDYKSVDLGAVGGIEYLFTKGWNLSLRYQYGVTNLEKNPPQDSYLKLHALTVAVGYLFNR